MSASWIVAGRELPDETMDSIRHIVVHAIVDQQHSPELMAEIFPMSSERGVSAPTPQERHIQFRFCNIDAKNVFHKQGSSLNLPCACRRPTKSG